MAGTLLSFPDEILEETVRNRDWSLVRRKQRTEGEFSADIQETDPTSVKWSILLTTDLIDESWWSRIQQFADLVQGTRIPFTVYDPLYFRPLGDATGTLDDDQALPGRLFSDGTRHTDGTFAVSVATTGSIMARHPMDATQIRITGLKANSPRALAAGDRFSIFHGQLELPYMYKAVYDAFSDADGMAVVTITPGLRFPTRIGDIVQFWKPPTTVNFAEEPRFPAEHPSNAVIELAMTENLALLQQGDDILEMVA